MFSTNDTNSIFFFQNQNNNNNIIQKTYTNGLFLNKELIYELNDPVNYISITSKPEFSKYSFEELRLSDYNQKKMET